MIYLITTNFCFESNRKAVGLSGRSLRKLPFITFANYFSQIHRDPTGGGTCSLPDFLDAMIAAVDQEILDRQAVEKHNSKNFNNANNSISKSPLFVDNANILQNGSLNPAC